MSVPWGGRAYKGAVTRRIGGPWLARTSMWPLGRSGAEKREGQRLKRRGLVYCQIHLQVNTHWQIKTKTPMCMDTGHLLTYKKRVMTHGQTKSWTGTYRCPVDTSHAMIQIHMNTRRESDSDILIKHLYWARCSNCPFVELAPKFIKFTK